MRSPMGPHAIGPLGRLALSVRTEVGAERVAGLG